MTVQVEHILGNTAYSMKLSLHNFKEATISVINV